jgi:hypothetical protein
MGFFVPSDAPPDAIVGNTVVEAKGWVWPSGLGVVHAQLNTYRSALASELRTLNYQFDAVLEPAEIAVRIPVHIPIHDYRMSAKELQVLISKVLQPEYVVACIWGRGASKYVKAIHRLQRRLRHTTKFAHLLFSWASQSRTLSLFVVERDWYLHHTAHPPATPCKAMDGLAMSRVCPGFSIVA